jgi:hypothetical protein
MVIFDCGITLATIIEALSFALLFVPRLSIFLAPGI